MSPSNVRLSNQALRLLWSVAVLVAALNAVVFAYRVRIQYVQFKDLRVDPAIQSAARRVQALPKNARLLLVMSHKDVPSVWVHYRINYFLYPHRHEVAWETFPGDAATRYDLVLAYGRGQAVLPPDWHVIEHTDLTTLASPPTHASALQPSPPPKPQGSLLVGAFGGILSLISLYALGALLMGRTLRARPFPYLWANLAVAHLVGATALTWIEMVWVLVFGKLIVWPVYVCMVVLLLLPGGKRLRDLLVPPGERRSPTRPRWTWQEVGLLAFIALGALIAVEIGVYLGLDWDGYMIWQFKAKAFFWDGNFAVLRDPIHYDYAHFDYPLLVPLQTWWTFMHFGGFHDYWVQAHGLLFYADLLALFAASARRTVSRPLALTGTALTATLPVLMKHSVSGFADIEMTVFLLASAVFLARLVVDREKEQMPTACWMLAGLVLTKNEGLLGTLGVIVVAVACAWWCQDRTTTAKEAIHSRLQVAGALLLAAVIAFLPWQVFKTTWHLSNDILQAEHSVRLTGSLLWWRLGQTLWTGFALQFARIGLRQTYPVWGLLALLVLVGAIHSLRQRIRVCYPLWLLVCWQLVGYVGLYLVTIWPLLRHLESSVDRLVLHMAPTLLLAALWGTGAEPLADAQSSRLPLTTGPSDREGTSMHGEDPMIRKIE